MSVFEKCGPANTDAVLSILQNGVVQHGVSQVVVASTYGDTGLAVARLFRDSGVRVVVVTHNAGFKEQGAVEMTPGTRQEIEALGGVVFTGTMPFRGIGAAIRGKQGYSQEDLVANTLRIMGQGIKVCVEIVLMAADAGLLDSGDVLAVAGTCRGADTVALIAPRSSNELFALKIRQILVKPAKW